MSGIAEYMKSWRKSLCWLTEKERDASFHSNHPLNNKFITLAFLKDHVDELDIMDRKAITLTLYEDIIEPLNRKQFGGEAWNGFFRWIAEYIPERIDWERGAKHD